MRTEFTWPWRRTLINGSDVKYVFHGVLSSLGPGKTRTRCDGNIVFYDVARPSAKRCTIVARGLDTTNVSEDFQKHFLCPGRKICARHMLRAWQNEATFRKHHRVSNVAAAIMCPSFAGPLHRCFANIEFILLSPLQGMGIYLFGELLISGQPKQIAIVKEVLDEIGPEMDRCTYRTVQDMLLGND